MDTRRQANADINQSNRAATLRDQVYRHLIIHGPKMADETAAELGESLLSIRPRFSELRNDFWIYDTGKRGVNPHSGKAAAIWEALEPELRRQVIEELS